MPLEKCRTPNLQRCPLARTNARISATHLVTHTNRINQYYIAFGDRHASRAIYLIDGICKCFVILNRESIMDLGVHHQSRATAGSRNIHHRPANMHDGENSQIYSSGISIEPSSMPSITSCGGFFSTVQPTLWHVPRLSLTVLARVRPNDL